jgi:pilus assembly protein Flp/PilA
MANGLPWSSSATAPALGERSHPKRAVQQEGQPEVQVCKRIVAGTLRSSVTDGSDENFLLFASGNFCKMEFWEGCACKTQLLGSRMKFRSAAALFSRFRSNQAGATVIEYSLVVALISVMIIAGTTSIGQRVASFFNAIRW